MTETHQQSRGNRRQVFRQRVGFLTSRTRHRDASFELDISPVWETLDQRAATTLRRRDALLRRLLAGADVLAVVLAWTLVIAVLGGGAVSLRVTDVLLIPFVVLTAHAIGLYDRDQHVLRRTTVDEIPSLLYLSVLFAISVWLTEGLLIRGWLTRPEVFALLVTSFILLALTRSAARVIIGVAMPPERCLIIGSALDAARISNKLAASAGVRAEVVGRLPLSPEVGDSGRDTPSLLGPSEGATQSVPDMTRLIRTERIERVIVAPDGHDQEEILDVIRVIKALRVKVSVLPRLLEVVGSSSLFEDVEGLTLLGVRQYGVSKSSGWLKRAMDVAVAFCAVLILAPLFALLALAIRFDSRGPVFFRQRRIGRRGETFSMIKFRSMVPDAEMRKHHLRDLNEAGGGLFKISEDPRITRVGRFIRRTSLDELPQLLNVVAGHMSLVGPRPLVADEDALIEGWKRRRLALRPGMTGMWQIYGSSRIPLEEMVKIDYLYGANWSLWLDLKILLRTVPYVARRRGI